MSNTTGKKYGGRKAGTPNKMTKELRSELKNILSGEIEKLPAHFEKLPEKDRIELLIKFLPYTLPKVDAEKYTIGEGGLTDDWN